MAELKWDIKLRVKWYNFMERIPALVSLQNITNLYLNASGRLKLKKRVNMVEMVLDWLLPKILLK